VDWVDAAPFRAQIRHLMAAFSLHIEDVAAAAGISARLAEHLVHGRNGRLTRRISPDIARRLLRLSDDQVRFLGRLRVPAGPARVQLARLRRAGWDDLSIAERVGVSAPDLECLATTATTCSQLLTVRLTAAARANEPGSWAERSDPSAAVAA
jgi:hypothetical protein